MPLAIVKWSAEAEGYLARAQNPGGLADTRAEVERGASQLWRCTDDAGALCGYAVTRLERYPSGDEWCWVACAGRDIVRFARTAMLEAEARGLSIRVHLTKESMRRWYRRLGFHDAEFIMRRDHGPVRRQEFA